MLKILKERKKGDVTMESILVYDDDDVFATDFSSWELVDPSDDETDGYSYNESDLEDRDENEVRKDPHLFRSPSSDISMELLSQQLSLQIHGQVVYEDNESDDVVADAKNGMYVDDDEYDEDEDRYDDDEEEYDLDDELVPKSVSDRFERQRMRKLGKRAHSKMNKSKRSPHFYNRPGCVRGKHGLGLKHNLIG